MGLLYQWRGHQREFKPAAQSHVLRVNGRGVISQVGKGVCSYGVGSVTCYDKALIKAL